MASEYSFHHMEKWNLGLIWEGPKVISSWVGTKNVKAFLSDFDTRLSSPKKIPQRDLRISNIQPFLNNGKLERIPHKLDSKVSVLAVEVYRQLKKISCGDLISYKELGENTELPFSSQAIGQIVGKNPLPGIIPCHRVVGKSNPGGFSASGGLKTKSIMLLGEGIILDDTIPKTVFDRDFELNKATNFLKKREPRLKSLIEQTPSFQTAGSSPIPPFPALARAIIYQQLSGKAAGTIFGRVLQGQNSGKKLNSKWMKTQSVDQLRQYGVSRAKALALKALANSELEGQLPSLSQIKKMPDFMVRRKLSKIKGIGPWTVEMYLLFSLGRVNIFSPGDLALIKGLEKLEGRKISSPQEALKLTRHWSPYRSIGSWYLWRMFD